jgi:hypothetical protein
VFFLKMKMMQNFVLRSDEKWNRSTLHFLQYWNCGVVQGQWVKCKTICIEVKYAVLTVA